MSISRSPNGNKKREEKRQKQEIHGLHPTALLSIKYFCKGIVNSQARTWKSNDANKVEKNWNFINTHFPQRGLNLKSCVLPISLQEPLKHL